MQHHLKSNIDDPSNQHALCQDFDISIPCSEFVADCDSAYLKIRRSDFVTKATLVKITMSKPRHKTVETSSGDTIHFDGLHTSRYWDVDILHGKVSFKKRRFYHKKNRHTIYKDQWGDAYVFEIVDDKLRTILPIYHIRISSEIYQ